MESKTTWEELGELCTRIGDLEDFKEKLSKTFQKDYSVFAKKKSSILKHSYFETLVRAVEEATKKLEGEHLSLCTTEHLEAFFKELLRQTIGKDVSFSKCLFETNLSIRETEKLLETSGHENLLMIISPFPRKYGKFGLVEDTGIPAAYMDEVFERMNIYFSKSKGDLIGVIFTIDYGEIIWVDNYDPKQGVKSSQVSLFKLYWYSFSLYSFMEFISNDLLTNVMKIPLGLLQNLERLFVFFDFLSTIVLQGEKGEKGEKGDYVAFEI